MPTSFGEPHHHHELTDSTNLEAKELAAAGAPSGTVVTAAEQSAGRGRGERVWTAPPGKALLYSAILRPLELEHLLLPLAVPLAVCAACESLAPVGCEVKWPNDVWLDERKLAGVLIEARPPEWAVIGVGVNVSIAEDGVPRRPPLAGDVARARGRGRRPAARAGLGPGGVGGRAGRARPGRVPPPRRSSAVARSAGTAERRRAGAAASPRASTSAAT